MNKALRCAEPAQALRALVMELSQEGRTKAQILEVLGEFVEQLRTWPDYRETDEDAVLDVMDALTGWCHPDAQLLAD